jgi:L-alanine-DL-glutamate epimerase-like enolase superfamily enzyme
MIEAETGCLRVPRAPGLGADIDEDLVARFKIG